MYHVTFIWPESADIAQRLEPPRTVLPVDVIAKKIQKYRTEAHALKRTYQNCLKTINADQPHVDVFAQGKPSTLLHYKFSVYESSCHTIKPDFPLGANLIKPYELRHRSYL